MNRLTLLLLTCAVPAVAADGGVPPPPNPVQKEMQALHAAMVTSLSAIELGVLAPIPEAFEQVHAAKAETEKALSSGAWVPPKPGTTVKDFIKQDEAFHRELERLEETAKKNDVAAASKQYGVVLNGCTACHVKFKFVAPPAAHSK